MAKGKGKGKNKDKQKSTKGKGKDKGKGKAKREGKAKTNHDFHWSTNTEGTTRAFPDQRPCILMARQRDHEASDLETIDERAKIVESLENIGGAKVQRNHDGRKCT